MTVTEQRTEPLFHRIPADLFEQVNALAVRLDRPRSRLVKEALRDLLAKYGETPTTDAEPLAEAA